MSCYSIEILMFLLLLQRVYAIARPDVNWDELRNKFRGDMPEVAEA